MSADHDDVPSIVFDMEDDLTNLDIHIEAFIRLTGKYDEGQMQGGVPYPVCVVLSDGLLRYLQQLREKWRRLFDLTREPDNVERLAPR